MIQNSNEYLLICTVHALIIYGHHGLFTNSKTFYNYMHKVKKIVVLSQSMLTQIVKAFTVKLLDSDTHRQTWYKHKQ